MKLEITGRDGALTTYRITGATEEQIDTIRDIATYQININGDEVTGSANKRQIQKFSAMEITSSNSIEKKTATNNLSSRRIVSLAQAERENLNHGKAWLCTDWHIDAKRVSPELEGELICYAYGE